MYLIHIKKLKYKYVVGQYTVGIIAPSGQKYVVRLGKVQQKGLIRTPNGTADARVTPEEITHFILHNRLV